MAGTGLVIPKTELHDLLGFTCQKMTITDFVLELDYIFLKHKLKINGRYWATLLGSGKESYSGC